MELAESAAKKIGLLLDAEVEAEGEKYLVKKTRTLEIHSKQAPFTCTLELDISFEQIQENGSAFNKAEIFLFPEEFMAFALALSDYPYHFQPNTSNGGNESRYCKCLHGINGTSGTFCRASCRSLTGY